MKLQFELNGRRVTTEAAVDAMLYEVLRSLGMTSVHCGCETSGCGMCTVLLDEKPVLSCSVPAFRVQGRSIVTMEGLQNEAKELAECFADQGADQCGFCNPGLLMNVLAMEKELSDPSDEEIRLYLEGNLCRCSGFVSQHRAIRIYLERRRTAKGL